MIKTKHTAFLAKCYWRHKPDVGWYLSDHKGDVYKDNHGLWLKHPTGYTRVTTADFCGA